MLVFLLGMFLPGKAGELRIPLAYHAYQVSSVKHLGFNTAPSTSSKAVVQHTAAPQEHPSRVHSRFEKKRKIKFLVRHLQHQPAVRKTPVRETFELAAADDPHHEPAPDEIWHTRPRYYIFLFRLCPF